MVQQQPTQKKKGSWQGMYHKFSLGFLKQNDRWFPPPNSKAFKLAAQSLHAKEKTRGQKHGNRQKKNQKKKKEFMRWVTT